MSHPSGTDSSDSHPPAPKRGWTRAKVAWTLVALFFLLCVTYFGLLTTSVFDCQPVPQPDLEVATPVGPTIDIGEWCEKDGGYQDWKAWKETEQIKAGEDYLKVAFALGRERDSDDSRKVLMEWADLAAERVPTVVRRMTDIPERWGREPGEAWDPGMSYMEERERMQLSQELRLLSIAAEMDKSRKPGAIECAELASRLAVRAWDDNRNLLTTLVNGALSVMADSTSLLAAWSVSRNGKADALDRLTATSASMDAEIKEGMVAGLKGEYKWCASFLQWTKARTFDSKARSGSCPDLEKVTGVDVPEWWVLLRTQPNRAASEAASFFRHAIRQCKLPVKDQTWPMPVIWGRLDLLSPAPNAGGRLLVSETDVTGSFRKALVQHQRNATRHALVSTTLALARYRLAHDDHLPDDLQALVPAYLPSVPVDWMDGKPLRYDAKAGRLWSIGEDLADNGGVIPGWTEPAFELTPGARVDSKLEPNVDLNKFFAR